MAIEAEDYNLISRYREQFSSGSSCAILGDCNIRGDLRDLGFTTVDTFDILGDPTYKVNLNDPIDEKFHNKYDWVIDSGTLYCCFNISAVLKNVTSMLKDSGCCLHTSNLCGWFGRGFYSISPSLYKEFYEANNFSIEGMGTKTKASRTWYDINKKATYLKSADYSRVLFSEEASPYVDAIPNDTLLHCFVSREKRVDFKEPIPEHYVVNEVK